MTTYSTLKVAIVLLTLSTPGSRLSTAQAAPGDLDTTFAGTGKVRTGFGGGYATAYAAAVQGDGKLILAGYGNGQYPAAGGDFLVARFDTNNLLDTTFGNGGTVVTPVSSGYSSAYAGAYAVKVQADGKIIASGYAYNGTNYSDFTLVRYNSDGSLDPTFGTNDTGIVYTDFGQGTVIRAMVIQADGRIVVAGYTTYSANAGEGAVALARYQTNGTLDVSFGTGGTQITTGVTGYTGANGLMIQSDGKIVAVGIGIGSGDHGVDFALYRYTTNGVLDAAFGGGTGQVFTRIGANTYDDDQNSAAAVATQFGTESIQNPDKIVVAGYHRNSSDKSVFALARYNLDGSLDSSFGNGGIVTNPITSGSALFNGDVAVSLVVQGFSIQPRKITVGGYSSANGTNYFTLARYNSTGTFDTTFGANGTGTTVLPVISTANGGDAAAYAMALQSGNFVLVGYRGISEGEIDFAAARFTSTGAIDTTFGSNGVVLADVSDKSSQANALAVQPDDKVVVAGYSEFGSYNPKDRFALARFNADGSLDSSFGSGGKLTTIITSNDMAYAVAVQPDGKIVAAGSSSGQFALARYNSNGSLDTSFGNNGTTTALVGTGGQANAVRIQPDGKIIAAGYADDSSSYQHFALARFNTNGSLDTSFGSAGKVITSISTADSAYGLGIQTNGKIVLGGFGASVNGSTVTADLAAARYNTNGALDFSFGSLGRTQTNVGGGTLDVGYAMAIQLDGKIIVAGGAGLGNLPGPVFGMVGNSFVALARFNTNGVPDASFGNNGTVVAEVGASSDYALSLALQSDGKIVVAGASQNGFYQFFAQRYNPDGSVDSSYGNGGAAFVDFGSSTNEYAYGLALDSFGRAVLAGDAGGLFGVARLQGDFVVSPPLRISLSTTNTAMVSWPYPSTGWNLQQNGDLSTINWVTPAETVNNDGTNNFIIVNPPAGTRFYRLANP